MCIALDAHLELGPYTVPVRDRNCQRRPHVTADAVEWAGVLLGPDDGLLDATPSVDQCAPDVGVCGLVRLAQVVLDVDAVEVRELLAGREDPRLDEAAD